MEKEVGFFLTKSFFLCQMKIAHINNFSNTLQRSQALYKIRLLGLFDQDLHVLDDSLFKPHRGTHAEIQHCRTRVLIEHIFGALR